MSDFMDPLKITYWLSLSHDRKSFLYKSPASDRDPEGLFFIDLDLEDEVHIYGMVNDNEKGTPENVFHFLRGLLSRKIVFQTCLQKTIPVSWNDEIIRQFRHQTEEHLWIRLKVN